jgi:transcriptional regulator with PAS, ATPase and Fis domain
MSVSSAISSPALPARGSPPVLRRLPALPPIPEAPPFVGSSPAIEALLQRADRLARTDVSLLISGESGTGKDVLARRIHARSGRAEGPFLAENCAAISEALFESELFGHARGAFTGADRSRIGLFQHASGGTLLLDEVGELPAALQAKLLRVLEDGRIRPVGTTSEVQVDVRIVSATNRDLAELVAEGRFREDLYYRLQGAQLEIPPLRERRGDVVELAVHFLERLNRDHGTLRTLAPDQLRRLAAHPWYGNARELRNVISLAYHSSEGDELEIEVALRHDGPRGRAPQVCLVTRLAPLTDIERDAISMALEQSGGNREMAARRLGISRSSIYERIRRHGI